MFLRVSAALAFALGVTLGVAACFVELGEANPSHTLADAGTDPIPHDGATPESDAGARPLPGCPLLVADDDPSLVAYFPFEEEDGSDPVDCSPNGHRAVRVPSDAGAAGELPHTAGHFGKALSLRGDACFDLGPAADLGFVGESFSVVAWIRPHTYAIPPDSAPRWFMARGAVDATGYRGWGIGVDDPFHLEMKVADVTAKVWEATGELGATSGFVHVVGVYGNGTLAVYAGGEIRHLIAAGALFDDPRAHAWIGCRSPGVLPFDGEIDDLRVYDRALTLPEIMTLRSRTSP